MRARSSSSAHGAAIAGQRNMRHQKFIEKQAASLPSRPQPSARLTSLALQSPELLHYCEMETACMRTGRGMTFGITSRFSLNDW